ncbi:AMP-binding protein [Kitasatospora sp. NPDC059571]|uniref:AMP-binding protein n=1 Tax=Kitasatospora sp. NPDC059571 TaxID=3346871 RepID=UPI0036976665
MQGEAQTVHGLFEQRAAIAPEATAVVCGGVRLSYRELDRRADRLARRLAGLGLGPGEVAAVALGRGADLVTAVLAVLKTGAAYVPVEPTGPDRTIRHVLADAAPSVLVTEEAHRVRLADSGERAVVCLDTADDTVPDRAQELEDGPPEVVVGGDAAACVFYTSGSTGLPKGAVVEHRNLLHSYRGWREVYGLTPADRFLQTATLEFDVFTADWVRALCTGGTLVMARRNYTLDRTAELAELHRLVVDEGITVMETNVYTARRLHEHLRPRGLELGELRLLTVGAEKWYLDEHLGLQRHLGPGVRVVNVYGVAEAAVDSTYFDPATLTDLPEHPERISLVGVPFPGNRVHLLDAAGRAVAAGAVGEICLSGPGVGPGGPRPADAEAGTGAGAGAGPDGRIHRTGDLGRWRPDGILEYIGRMAGGRVGSGTAGESPETSGAAGGSAADGVAVEVAAAEVEAVLRGHPGVRECAVNPLPAPAGTGQARAAAARAERPALVAYVVPHGGGSPEPAAVREYLADRLPARLLPDAVVPLAVLPRTRAGKLDRGALPLPAPREPADGPPRPGKTSRPSAKGGAGRGRTDAVGTSGAGWAVVTLMFAVPAWAVTDVFWPGSTDLQRVPNPWALLFGVLYAVEVLAFGLGAAFLLLGGPLMARQGRPPGITVLARFAVTWLLAAWWLQDNSYRTTRATDWPSQAALVYGFNVTLIVAALVLVRFLARRPVAAAGAGGAHH